MVPILAPVDLHFAEADPPQILLPGFVLPNEIEEAHTLIDGYVGQDIMQVLTST